jgi:acetyl-CoA C-acetyltransferase
MGLPAYIFDAIRTPRSRGKMDGALHEIKPVNLVKGLLVEMQRRHDLDTARVDDVIMGCVNPAMEQGRLKPSSIISPLVPLIWRTGTANVLPSTDQRSIS